MTAFRVHVDRADAEAEGARVEYRRAAERVLRAMGRIDEENMAERGVQAERRWMQR
jgi:hypothetical protein